MAHALKLVGLFLEGTHHRGIDDARNRVKLLPWILEIIESFIRVKDVLYLITLSFCCVASFFKRMSIRKIL